MCFSKEFFMLKFLVFCSFMILSDSLEFKYHKNEELETVLNGFHNTTKNMRTNLYSIGRTKRGNKLWVLEITAAKQKLNIPHVKLIGNMHGNEAAGREILLHFIKYLIDNYRTNRTVSWLLNNTMIHVMPTMNPDGFQEASVLCTGEKGRTNGIERVDLNRDFPDHFHRNSVRNVSESVAVIKWMTKIPFILSAALHGGALVANYPFDSIEETTSTSEEPPSPTPDDDVFKHLATVYAQNHKTMHLGKPCPGSNKEFKGGITNGAKWYTCEGTMGDYNYAKHGCMELTLEISCCKYPQPKLLPRLWEENKEALLRYCMEANRGVTGKILDSRTRMPIGGANLKIRGRNMTFHSVRGTGEFWRILLPGKYELEVEAVGYYHTVVPFTVEEQKGQFPCLTFLTVFLYNASYSTTPRTTTTAKTTPWTTKLETTSVKVIITNRFGLDEVQDPEPAPSRQISTKNVADVLTHLLCLYVLFLLNAFTV